MSVILLSGRQGSGKSTTQMVLKTELESANRMVHLYNFADPIYQIQDAVHHTLEYNYGLESPEKDGVLLQLIGTEWGRKVHGENVWVDIMRRRVDLVKEATVIIADCRFRNEFDAFPDALRVRLVAPEDVRRTRTHAWRDNVKHASEIDLDGYELNNQFDLYVRTGGDEASTPFGCAVQILSVLAAGDWKEQRHGK